MAFAQALTSSSSENASAVRGMWISPRVESGDRALPVQPLVVSVSRSGSHSFSKEVVTEVTLVQGIGVEGDIHSGALVRHLSRVAQDPTQPNLRQVHLIHAELFAELAEQGFSMEPGQLGENITTSGVDLLGLPLNTELHIGSSSVVRVTGLRNPCAQLDRFAPGLMTAVLDRAADGTLLRKAGIMGTVLVGGVVRRGDSIRVALPATPHQALERV